MKNYAVGLGLSLCCSDIEMLKYLLKQTKPHLRKITDTSKVCMPVSVCVCVCKCAYEGLTHNLTSPLQASVLIPDHFFLLSLIGIHTESYSLNSLLINYD